MERGRAWRRKKTESKWNSRCKRFMFESLVKDGMQVRSYTDMNGEKKLRVVPNYRKPTTWKEMKKLDPWAKFLKNSSTSKSWVSGQFDAKHANKMTRINSRRVIEEGMQEYDNRYDESLEDQEYIVYVV